MKPTGVIQRGAYKGQFYRVLRRSFWPRWVVVSLTCPGQYAVREVREEVIEMETEYGS